jgi:hypothetical protein
VVMGGGRVIHIRRRCCHRYRRCYVSLSPLFDGVIVEVEGGAVLSNPSGRYRTLSPVSQPIVTVSGCCCRFVLGSGVRCADTGFMVKTNHDRCRGSYLLTHLMGLLLPGSPLVFSIPNFSVELA